MFRRLKTYQITVDVSVAVVFFAVALPVEIMVGETGTVSLLGAPVALLAGVTIAVIFSAALGVRRWSPPIALALAWAGAVLQMALGRPPTAADLAIFGVLYVTAAYGTRRVYWAGFASALAGALVITIYLFVGPTFAGGGLSLRTLPLAVAVLVAAAFALLLAWTVGALVRAALRASANREAQERAEVEAATEQERVRIARDMHDVVAHSLAVVIAQADGARYAAPADPAAATAALGTISTTARAALADVRLLLTQLRHNQSPGPQPTLADLEELYAQVRAAGVELRVDIDPAPTVQPSAAVQLALYRILQEALTNALRHGDGGPVLVRLAWLATVCKGRPGVEFEVRNRLRSGEHPTESGHGLIGMGERANLVGGWLSASDPDGEFVVTGVLPVGGVE
ncbi:Signal transduction histidine kinase [Microbacterium sp. cf046]|uniref:sensor histidine kinase n=1 Tax=Microbacterium sp. cf046 TaxID=1761803 RepID=UPI0008EF5A83|nr:histidine kinase [Microbacterium sp. cf046]SFR94105.1 Signal transduction histidine kinase [Microbacterium sp. cf046]